MNHNVTIVSCVYAKSFSYLKPTNLPCTVYKQLGT